MWPFDDTVHSQHLHSQVRCIDNSNAPAPGEAVVQLQAVQTSGNKGYMKGQVNRNLEVRDQKLRYYWLRISVLYRAEPKLSLLVQVQAPVITLIQRMKIL